MEEKKVILPAISCNHCAMTIKRELSEIPGIQKIQVDVDAKQLTVSWETPASWDIIKNKLSEIGYPTSD
jgi:copper chaperone